MYRVVKTIGGRRYVYEQETYRQRGKVKTRSRYLGPVEVVGEPQFGRRLLAHLFGRRRGDDKGLEWAMMMVERLTGRTVAEQTAEMETQLVAQSQAPVLAMGPTLASVAPSTTTAPTAATQSGAKAADAPSSDVASADAGGTNGVGEAGGDQGAGGEL